MSTGNVIYKGNVVDMDKLNGQFKGIQELASTLAEFSDIKQIDETLVELTRLCSRASLTIEDAASGVAGYMFEDDIKKEMITLRNLARYLGAKFYENGRFWQHYLKELEDLRSMGLLPVVKNHGRLYANQATLAAWWRHHSLPLFHRSIK